jgi:hypothetical protein
MIGSTETMGNYESHVKEKSNIFLITMSAWTIKIITNMKMSA